MIAIAWRLFRRDGQSGEWQVLLAALVIAVTAMSAVGFFSARVNNALSREAHGLLAADAVVVSDHALPPDYDKLAQELGLERANSATLNTMAIGHSGTRLVTLKAVSERYPLRGDMKLYIEGREVAARGGPLPGTAWVDRRLMQQLDLRLTNTLQIGELRLTVVGVVAREPDNAVNLFNFTPRVLINVADLPATGLLVEGSRVRYRQMVAGEDGAVQRFLQRIEPRLQRGEQLESLDNARPELKAALERARQFLALSALSSVALAAAAIGLAARRYARRHVDSVAILRCLGVLPRQIIILYGLQWLLIGVVGCLAGALLGYIAQGPLASILAPAFTGQLPAAGPLPGLVAAGCGLILMLGFGWPALAILLRTPGLRALRRELNSPPLSVWLVAATMLLALLLLLWLQTGALQLALYALGGFSLMTLLGLAGGAALIFVVQRGRRLLPPGPRLAVAGLSRHRWLTLTQTAALALGAMALLALTVIRSQLLTNWHASLPPDAPNTFLVNIQPDQLASVSSSLSRIGPVQLLPMVRARLLEINGAQVRPADLPTDQAQRLAEREFNLSTGSQAAAEQDVIAGRWFRKNGPAEWSVESGIAEKLGIKLGDTLTYDIAGTRVSAPVTSLRKVRWDSFKPNFFVLASPGMLESSPTSYITAFYVPPERSDDVQQLVRQLPNITAIDVTEVMKSVKLLIDQVSAAVEYLFLFSIASGLVVLYAALAASQEERRAEIALVRTLGSSRQQVWAGLLTELTLTGMVAGLLAALGANLLAWAVSDWLLDLPWTPSLASFAWGMFGCGLLTVAFTWPWARRLLDTPPAQVLRNA